MRDHLFKKEAIPEYIQVKSIGQIYQIFCDSNKKNKVLLKTQLGDQYFKDPEKKRQAQLQNIKDDIILIQFKLAERESGRTHNI